MIWLQYSGEVEGSCVEGSSELTRVTWAELSVRNWWLIIFSTSAKTRLQFWRNVRRVEEDGGGALLRIVRRRSKTVESERQLINRGATAPSNTFSEERRGLVEESDVRESWRGGSSVGIELADDCRGGRKHVVERRDADGRVRDIGN